MNDKYDEDNDKVEGGECLKTTAYLFGIDTDKQTSTGPPLKNNKKVYHGNMQYACEYEEQKELPSEVQNLFSTF